MDSRQHANSNRLQTVALVIAMAGVLSLCGYVLFGLTGVLIALAVAGGIIISTGQASAALVLKMYRAVEIPRDQAPGLLELFDALVERADLDHHPKLFYVPSEMMNAFAAGRKDHVAVAVTDGLLRNMDGREIAGVLAHELAHIMNNDVFVMSLADAFSRVTVLIGQAGIFMLILAIPASLAGYGIPWFAGLVFMLAPNASALLQLALSRTREYDADEGAAKLTGDPVGLALALKKIEYTHSNWLQRVLLPGRREVEPALLRTHPPTRDRTDKLKVMAGLDPAIRLPGPATVATRLQSRQPIRRPRWHMTGLWY